MQNAARGFILPNLGDGAMTGEWHVSIEARSAPPATRKSHLSRSGNNRARISAGTGHFPVSTLAVPPRNGSHKISNALMEYVTAARVR
jgi:hypothetical protein